MRKFYFTFLFLGLVLVLTACGQLGNKTVNQPANTVIPPGKLLFYSQTCPHCQIVDQYINDNNLHQKLYFVSLEISQNKNNYDLATLVGQRCNISESAMGVPLFWDGAKCYQGEQEIINYFKTL